MIGWQILDLVIWIWVTMILPMFLIVRDPVTFQVKNTLKEHLHDLVLATLWPITFVVAFFTGD